MMFEQWDWNYLDTHSVWLTLKFDPARHEFHATVFDADGVSGEHISIDPKDAAMVAHYRQRQNRVMIDRPQTRRMK